jgi:hypothetical protein
MAALLAGAATIGITENLQKNRVNEFMEFLIILNDKHYKKSFLGGKSKHDKIMEQSFPGDLLVIHKDDLKKDEYKDIKIDETIVIKKLYLKVHKDNIYTDAAKYQDRIIESAISEFMRIIFSLNPQSLELKISNDVNDNFKTYIKSSVNVKGVNVEAGGGGENKIESHKESTWSITFDNREETIDVNMFLDKSKFYYLPNNPKWNDLIRNRLLFGAKDCRYVYHFTNSNYISLEFISRLHVLGIDFNYNNNKYENLSLEYNIVYYPIVKEVPCINNCAMRPSSNIFASVLKSIFG